MNYMLWAGEFLLFSHVIYVEATIAGVVINGYHDLAGWKVRLYAHGSSLFGIPAKYLLFFLGASTHVAVRPLLIHRKHGLLASHDTCNLEQFTHATFVFFLFFLFFFSRVWFVFADVSGSVDVL